MAKVRNKDATMPLSASDATFRREGDFWTLAFGGVVARVKDAKGLHYVRCLLSRPGEEIHALDLAHAAPGTAPEAAAQPSVHTLDGVHVSNGSLRQDVLDHQARVAYAERIRELEDDLAAAKSIGDPAAAERANDERDEIVAALRAAYGLGGRARKLPGDSVERARKAVTERIRTTLARIEKIHPRFGDHLRRSIRTGTYCSYVPHEPVTWTLDGDSAPSLGAAPEPPDVLIVDDHPLWRETLRKVIEHAGVATVVAQASDGADALDMASRLQPDVVLMDLGLPDMGGNEVTSALMRASPTVKVLVLSSSDERGHVVDAVAAGASGYLLKTADASQIIDAIRRVAAGELVFPSPLSRIVLAELRATSERVCEQDVS